MTKSGFPFFFLAVACVVIFTGCKPKSVTQSDSLKPSTPALLTFPGKDTVYQDEFEYVYQKNNGGWDDAKGHTQDQFQEYLDLYINFKRKVLEAEANGLHETESFKTEFEGYRKQLAQPYLVDKSVQEELVKEAYDRSQFVVNAAHILILAGPDSSPADTLKAYNKAMSLRDSIVNGGKPFAAIAEKHSEDPSARSNKGDLGYFSVFDMVYPFETGAFNAKIGEVTMPIRTGYGYHLIEVKDRVSSTGKKTAAHIIIRVGPQYSAKTEEEANSRIQEIYQELKGGADWLELCRKYSDDPNTRERGGDLGQGRLIPEMEDIKRKLGEGDFSKPFSTSFGHHILKITEEEPVKTFAEAEPEIKSKIARDARSTLSRERLIARVKKDNSFKTIPENIDRFVGFIDEQAQTQQYIKGFWRPTDSLMAELYPLPIYSIGSGNNKHEGTVKDFVGYYTKARKGVEGTTTARATEKFLSTFYDEEALAYEERQLPKKYREYRELLKEYRDGILLFTLTEDKVWRKAVEDTTGLKNYYDTNKSDFMADERVVLDEYISDKRETIEQVDRLLKKGMSGEEISKEINAESALNVTLRTQTYEKGKSNQIDPFFAQQPGYQSPISDYGNNRFRIFVLKEQLPAGQKSFDDAKSETITQYQNFLEAEWLAELKAKYPVMVNQGTFQKLFQ